MILMHQKLIWLTALIAVFLAFYKIKSEYLLSRSKALNIMSIGCGLLAFGAAFGLVGNMGVFGPGYSRSVVFFVIESIIGYAGGWTLLIWGMVLWLPYLFSVSSRLQRKTKSVGLYESIAKISAYGEASPATFNRIANALIDNCGFQAVSFHVMNRSNQLSLFASVGLLEKSREALATVRNSLFNKAYDTGEVFQNDENYRLHKELLIETESGPVVEALAIPVDYGTRRVGVMTIYTNHVHEFSREELGIFDSLSSNLGLTFYKDGLQRSINTQKAFNDFTSVVLKSGRSEGDVNTRVVRIAKLLEYYLKFTSLNLYIWSNGSPQKLDFNLSSGRKVIIEKGYLKGDKYRPVKWVLNQKRSLTLPDDNNLIPSGYLVPGNSRILYTPIVVNGQAIGVISISADRSYHFRYNDRMAFDAIASVISGTILEEMNKTMVEETFDRIGAIKYSIESSMTEEPSSRLYHELARILVEKTPATFCRIMLLNEERDRFQTTAVYQRRQLLWDEQTFTDLPLSELYSHRKVIDTGKPVIITNVDSSLKIPELEAKLLLPQGISQCVINPIIVDREAVGIVTVGESRKPDRDRLGSHQIVFSLLLTNVISIVHWQQAYNTKRNMMVASNRLTSQRLNDFENRADTLKMVNGFNSRINGPLAGILASCEYLQYKPDINKEEIDRYINIISKYALKIHKLSNRLSEAKRAIETITES